MASTIASRTPNSDTLRSRIPAWGVDLDPADRPSGVQEVVDLESQLADPPERQLAHWARERSIEHPALTPVFGTSTPPAGISGVIRRFSYRQYSEARAAHWLLLFAADRVDAWEHNLRSFATMRPDNPFTQTGIRAEFTHHGIRSRFGTRRADLAHLPLDPIIVAGPWVGLSALVYLGARRVIGSCDEPTPRRP